MVPRERHQPRFVSFCNQAPSQERLRIARKATASALVYSIVETAKANNVDVYLYLKYLLLKCPTNLMCDEDLEHLCPWNPECRDELEKMYQQRQKEIFDAM